MTLVAMAASLLVLGVVAAPPAAAYSCSVNNRVASVVVQSSEGGIRVTREGDNIEIFESYNNQSYCGTVTTIDSMIIDMGGQSPYNQLIFDLTGGAFAPGYTQETTGVSEIEFSVKNATTTAVRVEGSSGDEGFTIGKFRDNQTFEDVHALNLNAGEESTGKDNDVAIRGGPKWLHVSGGSGNDTISAAGTGTIGSSPASVGVQFSDGQGVDSVVGGDGPDRWSTWGGWEQGDSFSGGLGVDTASYLTRNQGAGVSLDDVANDGGSCFPGRTCENDNIHSDVEWIETGEGDDVIVGGAGDHIFSPGKGTNTVTGGEGNDKVLMPMKGTDEVNGGPGVDSVSYEGRLVGLEISLDGKANDGGDDEDDNLRGIEKVTGGSARDIITGDGRSNVLIGGSGNDLLKGGAGRDTLVPGAGDDTSRGGEGRDRASFMDAPVPVKANLTKKSATGDGSDTLVEIEALIGSPGGDVLVASSLPNLVVGGAGDDTVRGLAGNDLLKGGAGVDQLVGGRGSDTCVVGIDGGTRTTCEN